MESVVSISLIAICLVIALKVYAMVIDQSIRTDPMGTRVFLDSQIAEMKHNRNYEAGTFVYRGQYVQKRISAFEGNPRLLKVSFSIIRPTDTLMYDYLLIREDNEE